VQANPAPLLADSHRHKLPFGVTPNPRLVGVRQTGRALGALIRRAVLNLAVVPAGLRLGVVGKTNHRPIIGLHVATCRALELPFTLVCRAVQVRKVVAH